MNPLETQQISVKIYSRLVRFESDDYVAVFHRWVQQRLIDDVLVDVVSYGHVRHGPGVLLIGHHGDYALDSGNGRPGLRYRQKRGDSGGFESRLGRILERAVRACILLEAEPALAVRFDATSIRFSMENRLRAPNDDHTRSLVEPRVRAFVSDVWQSPAVAEAETDTRQLFSLHLSMAAAPTLETLAARLASPFNIDRSAAK